MSRQDEAVAAVREVMERYVDAVFRGDVEVLRSLFHPQASMIGYLGDRFLAGTPEPFFADIESHPTMAESGAPFKGRVSAVEVTGRAASAKLEETGFFGALNFINYFHLVDTRGDWKIVSKTFASL